MMGFLLSCDNSENKQTTILINDKVWMAENLNVSIFRNGDPIKECTSHDQWRLANIDKIPAYCYYDYDETNGNTYGKLYNWYAVNDPRNLAPEGWRIANDHDWNDLILSNGGNEIAGHNMKSSSGWGANGNGTNSIRFNGLPGGYNQVMLGFNAIGLQGKWWSVSQNYECIWLYSYSSSVEWDATSDGYGLSIRCVKESLNKSESTAEKKKNEVLIPKTINLSLKEEESACFIRKLYKVDNLFFIDVDFISFETVKDGEIEYSHVINNNPIIRTYYLDTEIDANLTEQEIKLYLNQNKESLFMVSAKDGHVISLTYFAPPG